MRKEGELSEGVHCITSLYRGNGYQISKIGFYSYKI